MTNLGLRPAASLPLLSMQAPALADALVATLGWEEAIKRSLASLAPRAVRPGILTKET